MEVLSLGLNFGVTPRKFPLVEYVKAAELLCQRLEEAGDSESVEKARSVRNLVFQHLKQSYKMTIKSNLTPAQRKIINEFETGRLNHNLPSGQRESGRGRRQGDLFDENSRSD